MGGPLGFIAFSPTYGGLNADARGCRSQLAGDGPVVCDDVFRGQARSYGNAWAQVLQTRLT